MTNFCDEKQYPCLPNFHSRSGGCSWDFNVRPTNCCNPEAERLFNVMRHLETTNDRLKDLRRCHMENTGVYRALLCKVEKLESEISYNASCIPQSCCTPCCDPCGAETCCGNKKEKVEKKESCCSNKKGKEEKEAQKPETCDKGCKSMVSFGKKVELEEDEEEEELNLECEEGCPDENDECICCSNVDEEQEEEEREDVKIRQVLVNKVDSVVNLGENGRIEAHLQQVVSVDKCVEARPPPQRTDRAVGCDARCTGVDKHAAGCEFGCDKNADKCVATCKGLTSAAVVNKGTLAKPICGRKGCKAGLRSKGQKQMVCRQSCSGKCSEGGGGGTALERPSQKQSSCSKTCSGITKQGEAKPTRSTQPAPTITEPKQVAKACHNWDCPKKNRERQQQRDNVNANRAASISAERAVRNGESRSGSSRGRSRGAGDSSSSVAAAVESQRKKCCGGKGNCCGKSKTRDTNNNSFKIGRNATKSKNVARAKEGVDSRNETDERKRKMLEFLWKKYEAIDQKLDSCIKSDRDRINQRIKINSNNNNSSDRRGDEETEAKNTRLVGDCDDVEGERTEEEGMVDLSLHRALQRTESKLNEMRSKETEDGGIKSNDLESEATESSDSEASSVEALGAKVLRKLETLDEEFQKLASVDLQNHNSEEEESDMCNVSTLKSAYTPVSNPLINDFKTTEKMRLSIEELVDERLEVDSQNADDSADGIAGENDQKRSLSRLSTPISRGQQCDTNERVKQDGDVVDDDDDNDDDDESRDGKRNEGEEYEPESSDRLRLSTGRSGWILPSTWRDAMPMRKRSRDSAGVSISKGSKR